MGVRSLALALFVSLSSGAHAATPTEVVLVKRAGVMAYEEVAEAFREGCRVQARVMNLDRAFMPSSFGPSQLVITVGQDAFDAVKASEGREIAVLAFHAPASTLGPPAVAPPELVLRALLTARPRLKIVGVVYGKRSRHTFETARDAGKRLGLELRGVEATDGPSAVRALRGLVDSVQALWLPFDDDVLTSQLFKYALRLQIERGVPLAATTRQEVHSGALLAVDFDPRDAGRAAADIANTLLQGGTPEASHFDVTGGARIIVNRDIARRLGVDTPGLERIGAHLE
jgi:hypothetical protein